MNETVLANVGELGLREGRRRGFCGKVLASVFVVALLFAVLWLVLPRLREQRGQSNAVLKDMEAGSELIGVFERMDKDGDGRLDVAEFARGMQEMTASSESSSPPPPSSSSSLPGWKRRVGTTFDPRMLVKLERIGHNILFRGSIPLLEDGEFAYKELREQIERIQPELRGEKFKLMDISLLGSNPVESWDIEAERRFFAENPELGSFVLWPTWGTNSSALALACSSANISAEDCQNPTMQPAEYRRHKRTSHVVDLLARDFLVDRLSDGLMERTSKIRSWLSGTYDVPLVIYFHCECGCDRTGELSAAYAIRYLNVSFTHAMDVNVKLIERTIGYCNQVTTQWLCLSLVASGQYGFPNDCERCERWSCSDVEHDCDGNLSMTVAPSGSQRTQPKLRELVDEKLAVGSE